MKILQIRLKNLNSLVGAWEIDLTHPAYETGGIFAITGPTGAGKTTILDAVCLALYGRTPRLTRVSKSANDIMSRQTGECYAEVSFATQSGRYRCNWSQRRARKKADGELQAPKHEIANLDTGRIVETKLRGVAEQIELVTGMDFDRFTRSMLLAQGGFAAFLQAAADERAPILEQITATGIYSQISIKVHQRWSEERKTLDLLQAELAGIQLLGEEEEGRLQTDLTGKTLQETELNRHIDSTNQAITWREGIVALERDLDVLAVSKDDLRERQQAFQPQRLRLERALQALELTGEYAALASLRRAQQADRDSLEECLRALPAQQAEVVGADEVLQRAEAVLAGKRKEQAELLPLIRGVRELDLKLQEKLLPIRATAESLKVLAKNLTGLRAKTREGEQGLLESRSALQGVQRFLDENRGDEGLEAQLAAIGSRFDNLRAMEAKKRLGSAELVLLRNQRQEKHRLWQEALTRKEVWQQEDDLARTVQAQEQIDLQKILAGRDIADWRESLSGLKERKAMLQRRGEAGQDLATARCLLAELSQRQRELVSEIEALHCRILEQTASQTALERERELLENQLSLLQRIADLTEARQQLRDNEPCPLCGAGEHPYARGNTPAPDETTSALRGVRARLQEAVAELSRLKVIEAGGSKDLEHIESRRKDCAETIARAEKNIAQGLASLEMEKDASEKDFSALFLRFEQENELRLAETEGRVRAAEQVEKELAARRVSLEKSRQALSQLEREVQATLRQKEAAEQALARAEKDLELLAAELDQLRQEISREILPYGLKVPAIEDLDRLQQELTGRRDRWRTHEGRKIDLEKAIAAMASRIEQEREQIGKAEVELESRGQEHAALRAERDLLSSRRIDLFADKDTEAEEQRLQTGIEEAGKMREEAFRLRIAAEQEREKLTSRREAMVKAMAERDRQLQTLDGDFALRLQKNGFVDEQVFLAACLPEDERLALLRERERLSTEAAETEARWRDKNRQLTEERQRQLTDRPQEQLLQEREDQALLYKELQQDIGAIRGRLRENDALRQKQQERIARVTRQASEFRRWDMLHSLIGSADGKKYRNFAQGLTFEIMIGHANRQLGRMTDRYLLIRDEEQPLDLNVIDSYQAGEIRSTRNLSGGESFLVSLSLALGLSQMASRNVRLDSLFLDEGFGTLDEEALDTALQALAGLQQDGKLIGVISHVPALRERISARIQVSSRTGGRSVIEGPGCRKKEEK